MLDSTGRKQSRQPLRILGEAWMIDGNFITDANDLLQTFAADSATSGLDGNVDTF